MATITPLENKMSGKVFRETLNANFTNLNQDTQENRDNIDKNYQRINTVAEDMEEFHAGYDKVLVSSTTSESGTINLPLNGSSDSVTVTGQDVFEQTTEGLNTAIANIIKGDYLQAGDNITLTKSATGVTISADSGGTPPNPDWQHSNPNLLMNADWRHPSSHRCILHSIKTDDSVETVPHPSIDCWEVNFPNRQNAGYVFYDEENQKYVAYQGNSPTDPDNGDGYATISQSFKDDWGNFLIGKRMTLSVAVYKSYADYSAGTYDIESYTFTAQEGYTGWMDFTGIPNFQFGIHFNTPIGNRIENEITIRFHNVWVQALKLEIGESSTLNYDLMQPVNAYEQAENCERYIQSTVANGVMVPSSMTSIDLFVPYYKTYSSNRIIITIPKKQNTFGSNVHLEAYDVNETKIDIKDCFKFVDYVTGGPLPQPDDIVFTLEDTPNGSPYFNITCTNPPVSSDMAVALKNNLIFACEETYNS